jgi:hypothetical protein
MAKCIWLAHGQDRAPEQPPPFRRGPSSVSKAGICERDIPVVEEYASRATRLACGAAFLSSCHSAVMYRTLQLAVMPGQAPYTSLNDFAGTSFGLTR